MDLKVAICIVGYRNPHEVRDCLGCLADLTYKNFEVVICENGGTQAFRQLQAQIPQMLPGGQMVRMDELPDNPGFAAGVNACIRASADADCWWVLNPDTCPEPDALSFLMRRLARGDVHAVGGVLYGRDQVVQCYGGGWTASLSRTRMIGSGASLEDSIDGDAIEAEMSYIIGASMLVDRRFTQEAGLLREDYFLYCEEVEWCLRARMRGLQIGFAPQARVMHLQGTTTGSSTEPGNRSWLNVYLNERNKLLLVRDTDVTKLLLAAPSAALLLLIRYGRHRAWRQLGFGLSGWLAALKGERGKPEALKSHAGHPSDTGA